MTIPLRSRADLLNRVDEVWRSWRCMSTAPNLSWIDSWHVRRQHGGMVQVGFTSEFGWTAWTRFLGFDFVKRPNELVARGQVDGVTVVLFCPRQPGDEAGVA